MSRRPQYFGCSSRVYRVLCKTGFMLSIAFFYRSRNKMQTVEDLAELAWRPLYTGCLMVKVTTHLRPHALLLPDEEETGSRETGSEKVSIIATRSTH